MKDSTWENILKGEILNPDNIRGRKWSVFIKEKVIEKRKEEPRDRHRRNKKGKLEKR